MGAELQPGGDDDDDRQNANLEIGATIRFDAERSVRRLSQKTELTVDG
jgi:hypothetical protein